MADSIAIVPTEQRHLAQIEAWSGQNALKTLLKLPEMPLPGGRLDYSWVALYNDEPVAIAGVRFDEEQVGFLEITVKPTELRQGIGAQLATFVLQQPSVQAVRKLHALVDFANTAAQKILSHEGFSPIGYAADGRLEFERH